MHLIINFCSNRFIFFKFCTLFKFCRGFILCANYFWCILNLIINLSFNRFIFFILSSWFKFCTWFKLCGSCLNFRLKFRFILIWWCFFWGIIWLIFVFSFYRFVFFILCRFKFCRRFKLCLKFCFIFYKIGWRFKLRFEFTCFKFCIFFCRRFKLCRRLKLSWLKFSSGFFVSFRWLKLSCDFLLSFKIFIRSCFLRFVFFNFNTSFWLICCLRLESSSRWWELFKFLIFLGRTIIWLKFLGCRICRCYPLSS